MKNYTDPKLDAVTREFTKRLVDEGKLIEAGWVGLRAMAVPADAPPVQLEEMRNAFFAGAQHVFGSIMGMLEEGAEPTDADLRRMEQIHQELDRFIADFSARRMPTKGSG